MPILTQKALVLAKVETTQGVDAAPVATTDAFLCLNPVFTVQTKELTRDFARPDFSTYASKIGQRLAQLTFDIQIAGSGTAGTAPTWGVCFLGCSMAGAALTTPTRYVYTPITTGQQTLTLYVYYEGLLHKITGAMGTFKMTWTAGDFATIQFTFTGLYNTPTNAGYPGTVTLQNVIPPQGELATLSYNADNTIIVNSFNVDIGNKVVARTDLNSANGYKAARISSRNPVGGFDPEVEVTHTFWSQLENSTLSDFNATLGSTAGNQLKFDAPQCQIQGIQYKDNNNLRMWDMTLAFRRSSSGNDELSLTFL